MAVSRDANEPSDPPFIVRASKSGPIPRVPRLPICTPPSMIGIGADGGKRRTGLRDRLRFVYVGVIDCAFGRGWPDENAKGAPKTGAFFLGCGRCFAVDPGAEIAQAPTVFSFR